MRKRFYHFRVCSCSPTEGVVYMESNMLRDIVNREIHPIRCASTCGRKASKGLVLGDLCAEAHHPQWALKVWMFVMEQIHWKDYEDWCNVWFNTKYVSFHDVISDGICEIIGKRIDRLNIRYGWAQPEGRNCWEYYAGDGFYDSFCYEKFDNDWDRLREKYITIRSEAMAAQQTERILRDGQGELPPQAQDFFYYWEDFDPTEQDMYFKIDDWD